MPRTVTTTERTSSRVAVAVDSIAVLPSSVS
jgi:hypothetical protein